MARRRRRGAAAQASSSSREESAPAATVLLAGGAYGALVGGGALSVLHLVHNRVDGVRDALAIGIFFVLLAGLAAAAATALGLLVHRVVARDRNRGAGDRSRDRAARFGADLGWALAVLHLGYFLPFALYGLTYDEVPLLGPPASATNMIVALVLLGVVVAAITLVATRWIARAIAGVVARGALRRWVLRGAAAVLALHVLLPLGFAARARLMPDAATPDTTDDAFFLYALRSVASAPCASGCPPTASAPSSTMAGWMRSCSARPIAGSRPRRWC